MGGIEMIDKNLAVIASIDEKQYQILNVRSAPFSVYGLICGEPGEPFRRLPMEVAQNTNPGVLRLHTDTAGGRLRFRTDSSCVAIIARMPKRNPMPHMTILGSSGFDLYETIEGTYHHKGSFIPPIKRDGGFQSVINMGSQKMRDLVIHFPLYDGVNELLIGLDPDAQLQKGGSYRKIKPIIYYGSSITQGGCASKPANSYTNIISRNLNVDHVNLGFSGSGKGEPVMADYIAKQEMSLFVYDYDHNAPDTEYLEKTHEAFFLRIRERHPDLPVLMASRTDVPKTDDVAKQTDKRRKIICETYENALKRGDKNVRFVDGTNLFERIKLLGLEADACTVDGIHPNDLGFACIATAFEREIRQMLRL